MTKALLSAVAILGMATTSHATLLSTFNVQGSGGGNAAVTVTAADLIANPGFVPVALGAGDVVTNSVFNSGGTVNLENGLTISQSSTNSNASFNFAQAASGNANPIFQNYLAANSGFAGGDGTNDVAAGTITIGGLDDSLLYNIHLLAAGNADLQGSTFTLGTDVQTTLVTDSTTADATLGENLVTFNQVSSTGGEIVIQIDDNFAATGNSSNFFFLSGGQIEVVPEPASLSLLALVGIAGVLRRR